VSTPDQEELARVFRALGRWLDQAGGELLEFTADEVLQVVWQHREQRTVRRFPSEELLLRSLDAQVHRRSRSGAPNDGYEEQLRVLGQQLAAEQVTVARIIHQHGSYTVRALTADRPLRREVSVAALLSVSHSQQQLRAGRSRRHQRPGLTRLLRPRRPER
jgi:hypothetical protein